MGALEHPKVFGKPNLAQRPSGALGQGWQVEQCPVIGPRQSLVEPGAEEFRIELALAGFGEDNGAGEYFSAGIVLSGPAGEEGAFSGLDPSLAGFQLSEFFFEVGDALVDLRIHGFPPVGLSPGLGLVRAQSRSVRGDAGSRTLWPPRVATGGGDPCQ